MIQVLARVPIARLARSPRAWLPIAAWSALAILVAITARQSPSGGADQALLGGFGSFAVPLVAFAVVSAALAGNGLKEAIRPVVALGGSPSRVALATVLTAMFASAALTGVLGALVVAIVGSSHFGADLAATVWIAALGGACYAAWFSFAATFGVRGTGRATFLIVDYLFGTSSGGNASTLAFFTPRGNLHSLLGGAAPNDISQRASSLALVLITAVCVLLAVRRART